MSPSSSLLLLPPILLSRFACVRRNCADRGTVIFVCRSWSSWLCNSLISVRSKDWSSWTSTYSPAAISLGTYVCSSCRTWLHSCAASGRRDGAHHFWCEVKEVICESVYLCLHAGTKAPGMIWLSMQLWSIFLFQRSSWTSHDGTLTSLLWSARGL
jgi:hypothetical protein